MKTRPQERSVVFPRRFARLRLISPVETSFSRESKKLLLAFCPPQRQNVVAHLAQWESGKDAG